MGSTKTEKESNTLSGSVISVVWLVVLNSAQSSGKKKKIGNVTVKNSLKEGLSTILCFIIQGKGSSGKGLNLKFIMLRMVILTRLSLILVFRHAMKYEEVFASKSKYVVFFNKFFCWKWWPL